MEKASETNELEAPSEASGRSAAASEDLLTLARKQFARCVDAESANRGKMVDDLRFLSATPDDPNQWPSEVVSFRTSDPQGARPCLTMNQLPPFVNQIVNDIRQNKPSIKTLPVDDAGDVQLAKIYNGMIRHIEYDSQAEVAYMTAVQNSVGIGLGFIGVINEYEDDKSFDQCLRIRRFANSMSVYMDPAIQTIEGSDAQFAFVTEMIPQEEFEREYPKAERADWETMAKGDAETLLWYDGECVRTAEWYHIEQEEDTLCLMADGTVAYKSDKPKGRVLKDRTVFRKKIMWRKITGMEILAECELPFYAIPLARVVGNEYMIEGERIVFGLVRPAKDAQRMYNYWKSQEAEMIALQPKAPWVGPEGAFDGHDEWKTANTRTHSVLEYVPQSSEGQPLPPPMRVEPPAVSTALMSAAQGAVADIKMTTGMFDPQLGQKSNEVSGRAILYRNKEGDTGTFHYIDNLRLAVRFIGRLCVRAIPKVYPTKRIVRILGEDGEFDLAVLDPNAPDAVTPVEDPTTGEQLGNIYNPNVGKYDVVVTTGPSYASKRQEALDAEIQLLQAQPSLWQIIGDIVVKNMDWPGADQMIPRLKATLLPAVQSAIAMDQQNLTPEQMKGQLIQMQQALQQAQQMMQQQQAEIMQYKAGIQKAQIDASAKLGVAQHGVVQAQIDGENRVTQAAIQATGNMHEAHVTGQHGQAQAVIDMIGKLLNTHATNLATLSQHDSTLAQPPQQAGGAPAEQIQERIQMPAHPENLG